MNNKILHAFIIYFLIIYWSCLHLKTNSCKFISKLPLSVAFVHKYFIKHFLGRGVLNHYSFGQFKLSECDNVVRYHILVNIRSFKYEKITG